MPRSIKQALGQMLNQKLEDMREGCGDETFRGSSE